MTIYKIYKENFAKTKLQYLGAVELFEDDRIVLRTMNENGLICEVGNLQVGIDL